MRTSRRESPQINAGSMADIAFLLLIFFLVTAMIPKDDYGFDRKLPPPCPPNTNCEGFIKQRNILEIRVNSKDELLVESALTSIEDLKTITKDFIDNNGDGSCSYCNGNRDELSSDNPESAVISLSNDKKTSYEFYIKVQDEITKAFYELREQYAENILQKPLETLSKTDIETLRKVYPFILSEAELKQ